MINEKFNRWLILKEGPRGVKKSGVKFKRYFAICDCGITKLVNGSAVRLGYSKSCGCLNAEARTKPIGESNFNSIYYYYLASAKKRNLEFNINKEQFKKLTKQDCHYCGIIPSNKMKTQSKGKTNGYYIYNGIDRVNNDGGYTIENTVTCCKNCNLAKRTLTQSEFFNMVKMIYERHKLDGK